MLERELPLNATQKISRRAAEIRRSPNRKRLDESPEVLYLLESKEAELILNQIFVQSVQGGPYCIGKPVLHILTYNGSSIGILSSGEHVFHISGCIWRMVL